TRRLAGTGGRGGADRLPGPRPIGHGDRPARARSRHRRPDARRVAGGQRRLRRFRRAEGDRGGLLAVRPVLVRRGKGGNGMRQAGSVMVAILVGVLILTMWPLQAPAQAKKLVYWSLWGDQNPVFVKWYEVRGKDFARKTGYSVESVFVPYI